MKRRPYSSEEIQDEANMCDFSGKLLSKDNIKTESPNPAKTKQDNSE